MNIDICLEIGVTSQKQYTYVKCLELIIVMIHAALKLRSLRASSITSAVIFAKTLDLLNDMCIWWFHEKVDVFKNFYVFSETNK